MGFGDIFTVIAEIFKKFTSSKKEQYYNQLKQLETEYAKALAENKDTEAAIIRKKMKMIRDKLGIAGGDI